VAIVYTEIHILHYTTLMKLKINQPNIHKYNQLWLCVPRGNVTMYLLRQTTPTVTIRTPMTSAIPITIAMRTPVCA